MTRRLAEGETKKEVMRCIKRYVVREIFTTIRNSPVAAQKLPAAA